MYSNNVSHAHVFLVGSYLVNIYPVFENEAELPLQE